MQYPIHLSMIYQWCMPAIQNWQYIAQTTIKGFSMYKAGGASPLDETRATYFEQIVCVSASCGAIHSVCTTPYPPLHIHYSISIISYPSFHIHHFISTISYAPLRMHKPQCPHILIQAVRATFIGTKGIFKELWCPTCIDRASPIAHHWVPRFALAPQLAMYARPAAQKGCESYPQRAYATFLCYIQQTFQPTTFSLDPIS